MEHSLPVPTWFKDTKAGETATYTYTERPASSRLPVRKGGLRVHAQLSERYMYRIAPPAKLRARLGDMRHLSRLTVRRVDVTLPRLPHLALGPSQLPLVSGNYLIAFPRRQVHCSVARASNVRAQWKRKHNRHTCRKTVSDRTVCIARSECKGETFYVRFDTGMMCV